MEARATAALTVDPPVRLVRRRCTSSAAVGERITLHPGDVVTPLLARANRDPVRPAGRHMAFGWGPHMCLGMHMGLAEMCVGARELFAAYPGLVVELLSVASPGDTLFRVVPGILVKLSS
ncbi:MAG TPA: hypothetical protein VGQ42_13430 [Candidatus Dormibacteraeota bacterium]|jgi:cytochrome P450|nr:hypothetical protein [Candidatus Dormibacteraeota bacterium]